jgi:hypothetical protein
VAYFRKSNAICNYQYQTICCTDEKKEEESLDSVPFKRSKLLLPDECGVSSVPPNRVVGGVDAKRGLIKIQMFIFKAKFSFFP